MADSEFEEFRQNLDQIPQHIRASTKCYTLVHAITPCEEPNFEKLLESFESSCMVKDKVATITEEGSPAEVSKPPERRRRKLPEIPKIHRPKLELMRKAYSSLAEELSQIDTGNLSTTTINTAPPLELPTVGQYVKSHLHHEVSPCESDVWAGTDGDSGRDSTADSPADGPGIKSFAPCVDRGDTIASNISEPMPIEAATHRGLHKFTARHSDEVDIDIGDPVYVQQEAGDDCWCEGVNLRTQHRGIFPSAYVVDVDYDFDADGRRVNKERYVLDYLGSVETHLHKGEEVLCAAVERFRQAAASSTKAWHPEACIIEISEQGLHVMDKCKPDPDRVPRHDYFFALKNVTFCGFHPTESHYLGFITKHPSEERFACHVFQGNGSTRHVAEAIGRAFQRFCRKFIELAYPVHEFYME